jgi:hypothetical protein
MIKARFQLNKKINQEVDWETKRGPGYRTQKPVAGQPKCPNCGERLISSVVNFEDPIPEYGKANL